MQSDEQENGAGRDPAGDAERTTLHGVEATLAERGSRYGDFTDHADLAQKLQELMRTWTPPTAGLRIPTGAGSSNWCRLSAVQKQALTVIADKIARILSGDPDYVDNWHDIQGYAKLAEDRCGQDRTLSPSAPRRDHGAVQNNDWLRGQAANVFPQHKLD